MKFRLSIHIITELTLWCSGSLYDSAAENLAVFQCLTSK